MLLYSINKCNFARGNETINMIRNTIPGMSTSPYWRLLKGLNTKEKLDLIALLSTSLIKAEPAEENPSKWASRFVGVWKD